MEKDTVCKTWPCVVVRERLPLLEPIARLLRINPWQSSLMRLLQQIAPTVDMRAYCWAEIPRFPCVFPAVLLKRSAAEEILVIFSYYTKGPGSLLTFEGWFVSQWLAVICGLCFARFFIWSVVNPLFCLHKLQADLSTEGQKEIPQPLKKWRHIIVFEQLEIFLQWLYIYIYI